MEIQWLTVTLGILGTLLGVALGSGLTIYKDSLQYRRQRDEENRKMRHGKLEELHLLVSTCVVESGRFVNNVAELFAADLSPADEHGRFTLLIERFNEPIAKIVTYVRIYAPELKETFNNASIMWTELTAAATTVMKEKKDLSPLLKAHKIAADVLKPFLSAIEKKIHSEIQPVN